MPNAFTWMTTCHDFGSGSGISLMTKLSGPPTFRERWHASDHSLEGINLKGSAVEVAYGFSVETREKIADRRSDLVAVLSSAKWPVSKKRTSAPGMSRLNASAPGGKKN